MKTMIKMVTAATIIALGITACEPTGMPNPNPPTEGKTFKVHMTDGPANFARMDLQISGVEIYHDTRGWITLNTTIRSINILTLANGVSTNLATRSDVAVGHYSRVRIRFADQNTVKLHAALDLGGAHFDAGSTVRLKWGGPEFFVDVPIDKTVTNDAGAEVMLDFDAGSSVTQTLGALVLKPVISEMGDMRTGARGSVTGGNSAAYIILTDGIHTYSAYSTIEGRFLLRGMVEGAYSAKIYVMKRNPDTGLLVERVAVRDRIIVRPGAYTDVGIIRF